MHDVKRLGLLVGLCILAGPACGSSSPAPAHDGGVLGEMGEDGARTPPSGDVGTAPDAPGAPPAADGPTLETRREDAATGQPDAPDAALVVVPHDGPAAELGAQLLDAGADGPDWSCPAGFYAPGGGPGGGAIPCDPMAPPGVLPCVHGRDGWCPNWCPALTICGPAGWVCCQGR